MIVWDEKNNDLIDDFYNLMRRSNEKLNDSGKKEPDYFMGQGGRELEKDVADVLMKEALGTPFENKIDLVSGQRFPDIVVQGYYGVEVKSSKDKNLITVGGSVNESTRIKDVKKIFLTFGSLIETVKFYSKPYEECLSDVVVTHYPRYKIDMKLGKGQTIFDKMGTTYDAIRQPPEETVYKIIDFYKKGLKAGESLWWTGGAPNDDIQEAAHMTVKLYNKLSKEERRRVTTCGLSFFPDIFSSSSSKYEDFFLWLVTSKGVLASRDFFSAGGKRCCNKRILLSKSS